MGGGRFAYLALHRLMRSPELKDVPVELRPMDPADLIFFDNPSDNPTKLSYVMHDAARQAAEAGLPPTYFLAMEQRLLQMASQMVESQPQGSQALANPRGQEGEDWATNAKALMYALEKGKGWVFADALCRVRWGLDGERAGASIEEPEVIAQVAESVGLDGAACVAAAQTNGAYDEQLKRWSKESGEAMVFGFPFFTYQGQRYWGNDRLPFLLKDVLGLEPDAPLPPITTGAAVLREESPEVADQGARRRYWAEQMDEASAFMAQIMEYPVHECGEPMLSL